MVHEKLNRCTLKIRNNYFLSFFRQNKLNKKKVEYLPQTEHRNEISLKKNK